MLRRTVAHRAIALFRPSVSRQNVFMPDDLRLAEFVAALSLATDLGMGQPLDQALRTCLLALGLGERLGLSDAERCEVYYGALLRFAGCTADAHEMAAMAGGDDIGWRAAVAPVLGGPPREFLTHVMPKVGAGAGPLRWVRQGLRAHCELGRA